MSGGVLVERAEKEAVCAVAAAADEEMARVEAELAKRNEGFGEGECIVCYEDVEVADRKAMPCAERHWMCGSCLEGMVDSALRWGKSAVVCPYCDAEAPVDAMPTA